MDLLCSHTHTHTHFAHVWKVSRFLSIFSNQLANVCVSLICGYNVIIPISNSYQWAAMVPIDNLNKIEILAARVNACSRKHVWQFEISKPKNEPHQIFGMCNLRAGPKIPCDLNELALFTRINVQTLLFSLSAFCERSFLFVSNLFNSFSRVNCAHRRHVLVCEREENMMNWCMA